jgi:sigma-E factor negative regulatory protein RseB
MVQCLVPEQKLVLVEQQRIRRFPSLLLDESENLEEQYNASIVAAEHRVAGRSCTLIDIQPKDALRYGHRLCVDGQTGLLLKDQTLDESGRVIDQIAFSALQFGKDVPAGHLRPGWDTASWQVVQSASTDVKADSLGWRIAPPAGFHYVAQLSRPTRAGQPLMHLVLSDGLVAISLFIEPVAERSGERPVQSASAGAMSIHSQRLADYWLTLVGEVPLETLKTLAARVEYAAPAGAGQ